MNEWMRNDYHFAWRDNLLKGIWPRSFAIWVLAFWVALLIIRPWEVMFPSLGDLRIERTYAIFAITVIFVSGKFRILGSAQTPGLILWFMALAISSVCAINAEEAWAKFYVYSTVFIFYLALLSVIRTPYQLVFMVTCYIVVMAAYLSKCQWEYFFCGGHAYSMGVPRLRGIDTTYRHPNSVACSAVLSLPFTFALWKIRKQFTEHWPAWLKKCFPYAILGYFFVAATSIFLTNSRSGIFAFVLFVMLVSLSGKNIARLLGGMILGAIFLAVIWINLPEATQGRIANTWDPTAGPAAKSAYTSGEGRIQGLKMGLEMCQRFPATGVGLGNFISYRRAYLDGVHLVAHNMIGGVLGEIGLLGGLSFSLFILGMFLDCRRTRLLSEKCPDSTSEILSRLATACRDATILLLFTGMFGDNQGRAQLYWIAAFCLLARTFMEHNRKDTENQLV